jgi:hypothetical protein
MIGLSTVIPFSKKQKPVQRLRLYRLVHQHAIPQEMGR